MQVPEITLPYDLSIATPVNITNIREIVSIFNFSRKNKSPKQGGVIRTSSYQTGDGWNRKGLQIKTNIDKIDNHYLEDQ